MIIWIYKKLLLWKGPTMFSQSNSKGDFKFILLHNKTLSQPLQPRHWTWSSTSSFPLLQSTERGITGTASASAVSRAVLGSWQSQCHHHRASAGWAQITSLASRTVAPHGKQSFREMKSRSLWGNVPFPKGSSLEAARQQEDTWPKAVVFLWLGQMLHFRTTATDYL